MKTVQQHLRELDMDRLLNEYLLEHPIEYSLPAFRGLSVSEIEVLYTERMRSFIEYLKGLKIEDDPDVFPGILFACRRMDWLGSGQTDYSLVYAEEALRDGLRAPTYAYDFSEQAEIMGFLVADNEFTQRNIYGLMADVLYEASVFGFNEEFRDEALRDISRTIKNLDKGKTIPSSELRIMIQTCNYTEPEEEDSEERMLRNDAEMAVMKYNEYCRDKELETIVLLLRQGPYEPVNPQSVTDA